MFGKLLVVLFALFTSGCVFISEPDVGAGSNYEGGPWLGEDPDDIAPGRTPPGNPCRDNSLCDVPNGMNQEGNSTSSPEDAGTDRDCGQAGAVGDEANIQAGAAGSSDHCEHAGEAGNSDGEDGQAGDTGFAGAGGQAGAGGDDEAPQSSTDDDEDDPHAGSGGEAEVNDNIEVTDVHELD